MKTKGKPNGKPNGNHSVLLKYVLLAQMKAQCGSVKKGKTVIYAYT